MTRWSVLALFALVLCASDAFRLNCGGPAFPEFDVAGDEWRYHNTSGGKVYQYQAYQWTSVYASHSWTPGGSDLVYRFKWRKNAKVHVHVRFMETWWRACETGRVMKVMVNGLVVDDKLNVCEKAGGLGKIYDTVKWGVTVSDGYVEVRIKAYKMNAMCSGIDIIEVQGNDEKRSKPKPKVVNNGVTFKATKAVTLIGSGKFHMVDDARGDPVRRHEACAVMVAGKVYLIGGRGKKPVSVFDPKTRKWTKRGTPQWELNHMQCVAWENRYVYIAGAWYGSFPREKNHEFTFRYDTATDTWAKEPGLGPRARGGGALVVRGKKLYLAMGNVGGHGAHAKSVGWLDVYDPKTKKWKALTDGPDPRDHVGGGVVKHLYCMAGGRDGGVANFWGTPVTRVNCYNFSNGKWERHDRYLAQGRAGAATGATCDGLLMIAGGEGRRFGTTQGGSAFNRVDFYDPITKTFNKSVTLNRARHGTGLAIADCKCGNIYLPSGSGGLGGGPELTSTEVWSPDGVYRKC